MIWNKLLNHRLRKGIFMIALLLLMMPASPAAAQEVVVIPIYIVVPGINDDGKGLVDLVSSWAYQPGTTAPPAWIISTGNPTNLQPAGIRAVLESGVRVFNVDMAIGKWSFKPNYRQKWIDETDMASDVLTSLSKSIHTLNEESDTVQYRLIVVAHSAGTNSVAKSWQEGARYDKALLLSPRFRVDIMADLARVGGMNASNLLVVTSKGDWTRTGLQPEPSVRTENRFYTPTWSGYNDSAYAGSSYTWLHIESIGNPGTPSTPHLDMVDRALTEPAKVYGKKDRVPLANRYQLFFRTDSIAESDDDIELPPLPPVSDESEFTHYPPIFPPGCPPFCPPPGGAGMNISPLLTGDSTSLTPDLGGVDFSSLQLNYFTESSEDETSILGYVFKATKAESGDVPITVEQAAQTASDSFFVWLAFPADAFWVNLNPNEANRIVDMEMGKTDAGRIMLEADFQMKKTVASLLHPDSALGRAFWDKLYGYIEQKGSTSMCLSLRQWIVPGEVTVWETADSIYIVNAVLDVKLDSEYLKLKAENASPAAACPPDSDPALQIYAEGLFREMILPELIKQVNTAPEYNDIRSIFHSRIVAEWYKNQHITSGQASFSNLIGQGSACGCYPTIDWDPRGLFDQYVQSVSQGEFNITQQEQTQQGNYTVTSIRTYFYGGVDFTSMPMTQITYDELLAKNPDAEQQVFDALLSPAGYWSETETWLGGLYIAGLPETLAHAEIEATLTPTITPIPLSPTTTPSAPTSAPSGSSGPCSAGAIPLTLVVWIGWRYKSRKHR